MVEAFRQHPYRWSFATVLALLTFVAAVGSSVGRWTHSTLFDTEAWLEVVGPISSNDEISDALAETVSAELIDFLEPGSRLEAILPPLLAPVAERLGTAIDELIIEETDEFFHSQLFDDLWLQLNETAHSAVVAIIRDQVPFLSTTGGVVSVDLEPLITPILDGLIVRLQTLGESVPDVILNQIDLDETVGGLVEEYEQEGLPDSLSNVVIYESDRLATVQQAVATFDRLVWLLPFMAVGLAIGSVLMAPRRRLMTIVILLGAALAWLVSLLVVDAIIGAILNGIDSDNAAVVAESVLVSITRSLDTLLTVLFIGAGLVGIAAAIRAYYRRREQDKVGENAIPEAGPSE